MCVILLFCYFVLRIVFVFCKPINCPSIVVVVAFLCKCLTALLDGATSGGREPSVSRYSQQKTFQMLQNHSMLNIHLSVRISAWIPLFVLKPCTLFDVSIFYTCLYFEVCGHTGCDGSCHELRGDPPSYWHRNTTSYDWDLILQQSILWQNYWKSWTKTRRSILGSDWSDSESS